MPVRRSPYAAFVVPVIPSKGEGFHTVARYDDAGELCIRTPRGEWVSVAAARKAGYVVRLKPSTGAADERRAAAALTDGTLAALEQLTIIADPAKTAQRAPEVEP